MKQEEIRKEMKKKHGKGKVTPFTGLLLKTKLQCVQALNLLKTFIFLDALSTTEAGAALGSSSSFRDKTVLENVILWSGVVRRYTNLKHDPK